MVRQRSSADPQVETTGAAVLEREAKPCFTKLPRHVGLIPDGNRRWARERGLPVAEGYKEGEVHPVQGATVGEVCCHVTGSEKFSSTVSFHIKELRLAGLINAEKSGKFMLCSVRRESVDQMVNYLASLPKSNQVCVPIQR